MGFKLGKKSQPIANQGKLKKKLPFKVERKSLEPGINAEAIDEKTIVIDESIPEGSAMYNKAVSHEAKHCEEMGSGKLAYGDDWIRDNGKTYARKDGKIKYNGKWHEEGSHEFPWEKRAVKAERS